jgi:hypothetical protein
MEKKGVKPKTEKREGDVKPFKKLSDVSANTSKSKLALVLLVSSSLACKTPNSATL